MKWAGSFESAHCFLCETLFVAIAWRDQCCAAGGLLESEVVPGLLEWGRRIRKARMAARIMARMMKNRIGLGLFPFFSEGGTGGCMCC
jgi:hypothetical protein